MVVSSEHKQVIVLRKDLNMRKGKMIAQGAHASLDAVLQTATHIDGKRPMVLDARVVRWMDRGAAKICVSVDSESELLAIHQNAMSAGLLTSLVLDAGLTEFGGAPTHTAVAVGPDEAQKIDAITGSLRLL
jgi:PTH2 family peptidyl-tRNA hydrolase